MKISIIIPCFNEHKTISVILDKVKNLLNFEKEIIIVDDLVATGGTAIACAELFTENFNISKSNILIVCVIDLPDLGGSNLIARRGYQIKTLMEF